VLVQTDNADSLLSTHRDLILYRSVSNALRFGTTTVLDTSAPELYAVLGSFGDEHVLVLLNLSGRKVGTYSVDLGIGGFPEATSVRGRPAGPVIDPMGYTPLDTLTPFETLILELTAQTDG
jgi:hypothetical protein